MFPPKLKVLPRSVVESGPAAPAEQGGADFALVQHKAGLRLAVQAPAGAALLADFEGEASESEGKALLLGPTSPANATALRRHLEWLRPRTLGLRTSAGTGDRLGLATPGHVRAFRAAGGEIAPIFAQQSIREMTRTGRTPQQVMDDATWGIFAEGWRAGVGADADHLKNAADIDACAATGFTFFTIDPGEYVDNGADDLSFLRLLEAATRLPWERLNDSVGGLTSRYAGQTLVIEDYRISFDEATVLRAAVKYGRAVAHVAAMYRHLQQAATGWELEVSVDETDTPTTHAEHVYIASELKRLGVQWVSLAPRYIGRFEKGVDYIGDLAALQADFAVHAAIARHFGPYKLSLHSGSDKFSIYGIAAEETRGLVHLKTAGTSYLEALRTLGALDPALFREIYAFARQRYPTDRASYHVSADLTKAPSPAALADSDLPGLLDAFDAREILHVTFGSVLTTRKDDGGWLFYDRFMAPLRANAEAYASNLESHFLRHLKPFVAATQ
jgi:tagaturonate epimerase